MKKLIYLMVLVPSVALSNFCPKATPLMKQYQSQKNWKSHKISEPGITISTEGYLDSMDNFFPDKAVVRAKQKTKITATGSGGGTFYRFCKDYENRGKLLTAFRRSNTVNTYDINMRYLPKSNLVNNDPYENMQTKRYEVSVEVSDDSIVGQLPRVKQLKEKVRVHIMAQLNNKTPVGEYKINLDNWDDFACDLVQGKASIGITRDMYSDNTFVKMEEVVEEQDVKKLYHKWYSDLSRVKGRDNLMFNAGVIYESLNQQQQLVNLNHKSALKMVKNLVAPGSTGIDSLVSNDLACLADSLQNYGSEYTLYQYNIIFDVDKELTLKQGE